MLVSALAPEAADLFFENGVIYTADADESIAEVLAVKDDRIAFVGSAKDGRGYKGTGTEVVDLGGGKLMLPGFFDTHIHSPGIAMAERFDFTLSGAYESGQIEKKIRDYVNAHPDREAYFGFGYETGTLEAGKAADMIVLDRNILEISPLQIEKTKVLQTYLDGKLVFGSRESGKKSSSSGCRACDTGLLASVAAVPFALSYLGKHGRR